MLMNYSFHANFDSSDETTVYDLVPNSPEGIDYAEGKTDSFRLLAEKIRMPEVENHIYRPRLCEILKKSSKKFGTTLVTGRAGSGKTTLGFDFAHQYKRIAWFDVDASDLDWRSFSRYLLASFKEEKLNFINEFAEIGANDNLDEKVQLFQEALFSEIEQLSQNEPILIILDDIHCVYDAEWYETFFKAVTAYNSANIHILMLARTKPPFPIWRLRSKQKLSVIDEQLLWFNLEELTKLTEIFNISSENAADIQKQSYGRVSKAIELVEEIALKNLIK